jgi:hypothetical protein
MSSLRSPCAPTGAEHAVAAAAALADVAENSFFAFVVPADAGLFRESAADLPGGGPSGWLVVTVGFSGGLSGDLTAVMPVVLAESLLRSFMGLDPDDPVEDGAIADAAGEFGNMLCGTWLTRACQRARFDLRPPAVRRMPVEWSPDPLEPAGDSCDLYAFVNDLPLRLRPRLDLESS